MSLCKKCGKTVTAEEMGLTMKLISRDAKEYMCIDCLAEFFECDTELLRQKIVHFKNMGCCLF